MKQWLPLLLVLAFWSCDKAPTKPVHDLTGYTGTFSGTYRELGCGVPPSIEYAHDSVLAEISIVTEDVLGLKLYIDQGPDLWDLEAFYINDSTFYITPFSKDQFTWTGNLTLTDSVRLVMANRTLPCIIQGDTAATVIYTGMK